MVPTKHARKLPDARISRQININQIGSNWIKSSLLHTTLYALQGRAAPPLERGTRAALWHSPIGLTDRPPVTSLEPSTYSRPYRQLVSGNSGAPICGRREHGRSAGNW